MITPDWPVPDTILALSTTRGDDEADIPGILGRGAIQLPALRQVHGKRVIRAEDTIGPATADLRADGIVSTTPGLGCRVETADCLPVLFCNRVGTEIAAVHAGWRGLAAGILERAVDVMRSSPGELLAWIGPAISQANYEVGREVLDAFAGDGADEQTLGCFQARGDKFLADLPALARLRLARRGVTGVYGGELCTFAERERFHSYRRDGDAAGRQVAAICIQSPGD